MKDIIVLYPLPVMGHLVPMVELAKLFLPHNFHVEIALMHNPYMLDPANDFIAGVSATYPSITFHHLPPHSTAIDPTLNLAVAMFKNIHCNNSNLRSFIETHSATSTVHAVVLDFFCTAALDVTQELGVKSYFSFSSGAACLATFLYLPTLADNLEKSFGEIGDGLLEFPGCPPIPANYLPVEVMDKDDDVFELIMHSFRRLSEGNGILVNTFEEIEARAVQALRDGLCVPGRQTPPVFCVGPLIGSTKEERHECIEWLDSQPKKSVVFLCFGSMGMFKAEQLKEIAEGLERSEQRFLWVVRSPKSEDPLMAEPELEDLFPDGFLERTKDRGMVVKKWAPQKAVLGHEAVGGFVTHGGWNSILESVVNGVPMVVWPLYAEQKMNKVFLVEEMKLAVGIEGLDKEVVGAEEVERKVRWIIESEEMRERTKEAMEMALEAKRSGGSSEKAFLEAVAAMRH